MEFYSNSRPRLVSVGVNKSLEQYFKPNNTNSIYDHYIFPNIPIILLLSCLVLFLYYRYRKKHMENFIRPTFNPFYPVNKQTNYNVYPPGNYPVKVENNTITYISDVQKQNPPDIQLEQHQHVNNAVLPGQIYPKTLPNYGYHQYAGPDYKTLNHYNGEYSNNTTNMSNSLGHNYPTDFNVTTDKFVNHAVDSGVQNIMVYNDILNNNNDNILAGLAGLNYGLDDGGDPIIVPPYAD